MTRRFGIKLQGDIGWKMGLKRLTESIFQTTSPRCSNLSKGEDKNGLHVTATKRLNNLNFHLISAQMDGLGFFFFSLLASAILAKS